MLSTGPSKAQNVSLILASISRQQRLEAQSFPHKWSAGERVVLLAVEELPTLANPDAQRTPSALCRQRSPTPHPPARRELRACHQSRTANSQLKSWAWEGRVLRWKRQNLEN